MTNAQWHGIDQHEGDAGALVAAVGPGVVGAALDHHVPSLHLHRRIVHVHLDLALEHDHIIDRLRAVHPRRITGREIDDREAGTVRRRRGAHDARPQILDLFSDCDVGRRAVGRPDERRDRSRTRMLGMAGPCMTTLATWLASWPVTKRRMGEYGEVTIVYSGLRKY